MGEEVQVRIGPAAPIAVWPGPCTKVRYRLCGSATIGGWSCFGPMRQQRGDCAGGTLKIAEGTSGRPPRLDASLSLCPSKAVDITSAACMYQLPRLTRRARRTCREKHIHHLDPLRSGKKPASSSEQYTDVATRDRVKYRLLIQPATQPKGQHDRVVAIPRSPRADTTTDIMRTKIRFDETHVR